MQLSKVIRFECISPQIYQSWSSMAGCCPPCQCSGRLLLNMLTFVVIFSNEYHWFQISCSRIVFCLFLCSYGWACMCWFYSPDPYEWIVLQQPLLFSQCPCLHSHICAATGILRVSVFFSSKRWDSGLKQLLKRYFLLLENYKDVQFKLKTDLPS